MFPSLSCKYMRYTSSGHREHFTEITAFYSLIRKVSHINNFFIRQYGHRVSLSSATCAVFQFISMVAFASIPPKIIKAIASFIPIFMARFHSWRAGTNKGKENKLSHFTGVRLTLFIKAAYKIAISVRAWFENSLWQVAYGPGITTFVFQKGSHSPMVTNFVTRKPRNRFPNFIIYANFLVSHGMIFLQKIALWLGPWRCSRSGAACFLYSTMACSMQAGG